jgi:CheY-like chemotaxis protein
MHGGTIQAASPGKDQGATFEVRLPLAPAGAVPAVQPDGSPQRTAEPPAKAAVAAGPLRLDTLRLLVVEDDDATRHIVAALLEDAGAKVDSVGSAAEARQRLQAHPYSAIVSDLAMPQEDGCAFMRTLRTTSATVPAVALTALARPEDASAAYDAGFQVYLTKPIDRDKLIVAIANLTLRKTA